MNIFKFLVFLNILIILQSNFHCNFYNNFPKKNIHTENLQTTINLFKNKYKNNIASQIFNDTTNDNINSQLFNDTTKDTTDTQFYNNTNFKYEKIFKTCYKISNEKPYRLEFYKTNNMKNIKINLYLALITSNTALDKISSITIYCNNIPVNSYTLENIKISNKINCIIDSKYIENGKNTISIKCNIKSSLNKYEINEEINWVVIEKCSKIEIIYNLDNIDFISNFYENTYYMEEETGKTTLIIPDNLSSFDYTLISTVSSLLGNYYKSFPNNFKINFSNYSNLSHINHSSIIVGTYNEIKNSFPDLDFTDYNEKNSLYLKNENNNIGFITIKNIENISHIFLIVNNKEQLINFTNIFNNKIIYEDIKTKNYFLEKNISYENFINKDTFKINDNIKNLGYKNEILKGNDHFSREYNFSIPDKKLEIYKNKFKFYFQYSEELDFENSYVSVYINNEPIKTQKLTYKKSQSDFIEFSIPKNLNNYYNHNIKLLFHLEPLNIYKNKLFDYNWVKIDVEKSRYDLKLKKRKNFPLSLSNSFLENNLNEIDGTILVDDIKNLDKEIYINFCSYIGSKAKNVKILNLIESEKIPENFIGFLFCNYNSNIIKNINKDLNIKKMDKDISLIDILPQKNILIITSIDKKQLNLAIENYKKDFEKNDLQIINKNGKIILKTENKENLYKNKFISKFINYKKINKVDIIMISYSLMIVILLILIYLYIKRKNDR